MYKSLICFSFFRCTNLCHLFLFFIYTSVSFVSHLLTLNLTRLVDQPETGEQGTIGLWRVHVSSTSEVYIWPFFLNTFPQLALIQSVGNLYLFMSDVVRINYSSYLCYISHGFMIKWLNFMPKNIGIHINKIIIYFVWMFAPEQIDLNIQNSVKGGIHYVTKFQN